MSDRLSSDRYPADDNMPGPLGVTQLKFPIYFLPRTFLYNLFYN